MRDMSTLIYHWSQSPLCNQRTSPSQIRTIYIKHVINCNQHYNISEATPKPASTLNEKKKRMQNNGQRKENIKQAHRNASKSSVESENKTE